MSERPLNESIWKRGWDDTVSIWKSWPFIIFDPVVCVAVGAVFAWYWGLALFVFALFCAWLCATVAAPIRQRNEARAKVTALEKEKEPCIEVHPLPCARASYERRDKTAWAVLKVKNASSWVDLEKVNVQIVELMQVFECQDDQGIGKGVYSLNEPYPLWTPANVYWDESNALGNQFEIPIPRGATRLALIAFHWEMGTALGYLNTSTRPPMLESRIVIEISSPNMNTWQGVYYIGYLPPSQDRFEFVEWDSWCESHPVNERSS